MGNNEKQRRRRAVVATFGVLAYFVAVAERSSLGVAALPAAERFHASAAELSSLTVFQLAVYAAMQIPVGLLLDRFGSRKMLLTGGALMGVAQIMVAFAMNLPSAVLGRAMLGVGDAFTFISMIRLVNHWYPGPAATRRTQFYANIGQLGQVFSAIPFAIMLRQWGWSSSFATLAAFALASAVCTFFFVQDDPSGSSPSSNALSAPSVLESLRLNLRDRAVRIAFWTHFTTQFSGSVFVLLWGYTFLTNGEKVDAAVASMLMASFVGIGFVVGPILAHACASRPNLRPVLVTGVVLLTGSIWIVVLSWSGPAPIWLVASLVLVLGIGGPASMIAFDYTRTMVPLARLGTANGFANIGGFAATFVTMFLIGALLDVARRIGISSSLYSMEGFRFALPAQFVVLAVGLAAFHFESWKLRREGRNTLALPPV